MTAIVLGVLAAVFLLGDQRRVQVVLAQPDAAVPAPVTLREITLTFDREPSREAVEAALSFEPPLEGAIRWRGRTLVFLPAAVLEPGQYTVRLAPGSLGRAGEPLREPFEHRFTVREPGVAVIQVAPGRAEERLVELRGGQEPRILARAPRIIDYAVSPDGAQVVVVAADADGRGSLALVQVSDGAGRSLVFDPAINIGGVAWSPDGATLAVVRRDELPGGGEGVPRAWLVRLSGEFVTTLDPEGLPSLYPGWSPDGQHLAYVSPSDARLIVVNLATGERRDLGQPRGGAAAWSPDSRIVAFESVPRSASGALPPQPVRVVSLDGAIDLTLGREGEIRSAPRFLDAETVATLRRVIGPQRTGTDLLLESVRDGRQLRAIALAAGTDLVLHWDLAPGGRAIVYTVQTAQQFTTIVLDLETGQRTPLPAGGDVPRWLP
ncbi:MAG: hypothetical protein WHT63_07430 [Tepidiforma sp.]